MSAPDRQVLERFRRCRVAVLADLVADEYLLCRTSRISREAAAALILRYETREVRPGGGANAIANLRSLGAEVVALGVVGGDPAGEELLAALRERGVDTGGIVVDPGYRTVVKSRVLTRYQHSTHGQVLRIDREDRLAEGGASARALLAAARERLSGASALLVSDYGYGAASPVLARAVIAAACERGIPVTLDSRSRLLEFAPVQAATPNQPELEELLGREIGDDPTALESGGRDVLRRLGAEALLVTRGSKGMALFVTGQETAHIAVHGGDEVADVTGAGDTVIAVFTLALAAGRGYAEAARLANVAGGLVVMKRGTATVEPDELAAALAQGAG